MLSFYVLSIAAYRNIISHSGFSSGKKSDLKQSCFLKIKGTATNKMLTVDNETFSESFPDPVNLRVLEVV